MGWVESVRGDEAAEGRTEPDLFKVAPLWEAQDKVVMFRRVLV